MRVNRFRGKTKCVACNKEFHYVNKNAKYCSVKCSEWFNRTRVKPPISLAPIPDHLIIEEKIVRWTSIK